MNLYNRLLISIVFVCCIPLSSWGITKVSCKDVRHESDFQRLLDIVSSYNNYVLYLDKDIDLNGKEFVTGNLRIQGGAGSLSNFRKITVNGDLFISNSHIHHSSKGFYVSGNVDVRNCEFHDMGTFCVNAISKDTCVSIIFNDNHCYKCASHSRFATTHILQCFNAHGEIMRNKLENIGSTDDKACSPFRIGDRDGDQKFPARNFEIAYNIISNVFSSNTPAYHKGSISAIAPAGFHFNVHHNHIENIHGIGYDREALYCKLDSSIVHHNYIKNGGTGQGSICLKSRTTEVYENFIECDISQCVGIMAFGYGMNIHNNRIHGRFKNGIRLWKDFSGEVINNEISIETLSLISKDYADSGRGGISKKEGNGIAIIKNNVIKVKLK